MFISYIYGFFWSFVFSPSRMPLVTYDIGKAINPQLVEGQIEGGIGMGVGFALMEKIVVKEGIIQNLGMDNFLIPTILDIPPITPIIVEHANQSGPYGAKGIGEMANIPSAPAIVNEIADACGGRVRSLQADPEKVFRAIREWGSPHGGTRR